jgi:hypothetical protein
MVLTGVTLLPVAQGQTGTILRAVRVERTEASVVVVIEGSGPLPEPQLGVVDGPPRIYLDFPGITRGTFGTRVQVPGPVRRVRVGDFQSNPLITRVVIDLSEASPHRLDASRREEGRIVVFVDAAAVPAVAPAKPAVQTPTASAPARRAPSAAAATAERDKAAALAALAQLERLRPVLSSVDSRIETPEASLRAAVEEFDTIRLSVASIRSERDREALTKICVLGATAVTTRLEAQQGADATRAWNAASAAAGALIMLDRARADLKTSTDPK